MKTKISEWSTTPASNTDIDGINIAEGCAPSGINDAIRDLMAQVRSWQSGASGDPFNGPMNGTIGATTAYSGAFTTVSATGVITSTLATGTAPLTIASTTKVANLNADLLDGADWASPAALGSTTPAAVSATTLSASGAVTLSGGTANGVTYLNGSKVLTSGSGLVFDGSTLSVSASVASATLASSGAYSVLNFTNSGGATKAGLILTNSSGILQSRAETFAWTNYDASSEYMRLNSTGLGIGTSSPAVKLDVASASTTQFRLQMSGQADVRLISDTGYGALSVESAMPLLLRTSSTERMRITSTGDVGIGTNSPSAKLTLAGNTFRHTDASGSYGYTINATSNTTTLATLFGGSSFAIQTGASGSNQFLLDSAGNLGLGVTPSAWSGFISVLQQRGGGHVLGDTGAFMQIGANNYYNGTNWIYTTTAPASRFTQNNGLFQWYTAPSGTAGTAISFTQAMTLDASGNLGIGTTTPFSKLSVSGGTVSVAGSTAGSGVVKLGDPTDPTPYVGMYRSAAAAIATSGNFLNLGGYDGIAFTTGATQFSGQTERARIDASGNLLVGSTNANGKLYVENSSVTNTAKFWDTNASSTSDGVCIALASRNTTNNTFYAFSYYNAGASAYRFRVADSGNVTNTNNSYGAISDVKLKENIVDASPKLADLMQVKVRNYNLIGDTTKQLGVVAQELETVFPAMVDESVDRDEEGNDLGTTTKQVKYSVFVPMLIKAIQELKAEFDAYKASHP